jgi:hypothetical protein
VETVIGPHLPSERVPLSTGGSQAAKVLFAGASVFLALVGSCAGRAFPGFMAVAGFFLLLGSQYVTLSEVETDGLFLYVSRLRKKACIPLIDVASVRLGWWWLPRAHRVVVELRTATPVGTRIAYEPPMDWMATAYDHRAVRELRALIAQATAASRAGGSDG